MNTLSNAKNLDQYIDLIPQTLIAIKSDAEEAQFCNDEVTDFLYTAYTCSSMAKTAMKTAKLTFEELVSQNEADKDFISEHLCQDMFDGITDDQFENLESVLTAIIRLKTKTDYFLMGAENV